MAKRSGWHVRLAERREGTERRCSTCCSSHVANYIQCLCAISCMHHPTLNFKRGSHPLAMMRKCKLTQSSTHWMGCYKHMRRAPRRQTQRSQRQAAPHATALTDNMESSTHADLGGELHEAADGLLVIICHTSILQAHLQKQRAWVPNIFASTQTITCPICGPVFHSVRTRVTAGCLIKLKLLQMQQLGRELNIALFAACPHCALGGHGAQHTS